MLSVFEINNIPAAQLPTQLSKSIDAALAAVKAPSTAQGDDPIPWNDCSNEDLKRQVAGSLLKMHDDTYVPLHPHEKRAPHH